MGTRLQEKSSAPSAISVPIPHFVVPRLYGEPQEALRVDRSCPAALRSGVTLWGAGDIVCCPKFLLANNQQPPDTHSSDAHHYAASQERLHFYAIGHRMLACIENQLVLDCR
jgi:hypothetical protein